ncbi:hypothetical protein R6Q57_013195 [Mikania cordata]
MNEYVKIMVTGIIQLHVCRSAGVAFRKEVSEQRRKSSFCDRFRSFTGLIICLRPERLNSIRTRTPFHFLLSDIEWCFQDTVEITFDRLMDLGGLLLLSSKGNVSQFLVIYEPLCWVLR